MAQRITVAEVGRSNRMSRSPQHPYQIRTRPWGITPFFIAPVLPGETMRNLLLQARCVTDPVKSPLLGWWNEYYFYYVKHRDLDGRDTFSEMMLNPATSLAAFNYSDVAGSLIRYHGTTGISWVNECLKRVISYDFRQDGEAPSAGTIGDFYAAQASQVNNWADSIMNDAENAAIADVDVDGPDANTTIQASEVDRAMWQWQLLRTQGMTNMTYEDYLASHGVRRSTVELHAPELVRYVRDFAYPANTIDPTDGSAASALSWKTVERADKDRYFKEPGFLFGVTVKRPKIYWANQKGSVTDLMTDLYAWLPAIMRDDVQASRRKVAALTSPLNLNTDAYWLDLKDLFLYGEQFVNFALTATDAGLVALPTAAQQKRYASSTDADALFASAPPANQIREDGIVSVSITGTVEDTSQTTV